MYKSVKPLEALYSLWHFCLRTFNFLCLDFASLISFGNIHPLLVKKRFQFTSFIVTPQLNGGVSLHFQKNNPNASNIPFYLNQKTGNNNPSCTAQFHLFHVPTYPWGGFINSPFFGIINRVHFVFTASQPKHHFCFFLSSSPAMYKYL